MKTTKTTFNQSLFVQKILLLISALVLAVSGGSAFALEAPEVWVKAVAEGRVAPEFDEESIAKSVLGKQLREANPEQKLAFQREFKSYITYVYSSSFVNKYKNQPAVYNVLPQPADGFYEVGSVVDGINMKYTLKNQSGSWRMIHFEFDGVSLVNNHRTVYKQEIEKNGIDGLIKMLKDKNSTSVALTAPTNRQSNSISHEASSSNNNNNAQADKAALTKSCNAESDSAIGRVNEAVALIQTGIPEQAARGMQMNMQVIEEDSLLYQGRCRGASNSNAKLIQNAKLMQELQQACLSQGYNRDCSTSTQVARSTNSSSNNRNYSNENDSGSYGTGSNTNNSRQNQSSGTAEINPAVQCVKLSTNENGTVIITNGCGSTIEVYWCVEGYDCKYGSWGFTNQTSLGAGRSYPAQGSKGGKIAHVFACDRKNAAVIENGENSYSCKN